MAPLNAEAALRRLMETRLPAVNTAGCHFSPVQGLTGESWRIDGVGITLLARQHSAEKRALGVSRRREARSCAAARRGWGHGFSHKIISGLSSNGSKVTSSQIPSLRR